MTDWSHNEPAVDLDEADDQYDQATAYDDENGAQTGADDHDEAAKVRLDAALAEIDAQFGRPPSEQVAAYADAHQALQATLNRIDVG